MLHNLPHQPQRLLEMADLEPRSVAIGPLNTAQTAPAGLPQGSKFCAHLLSHVVAPVQAVLTQAAQLLVLCRWTRPICGSAGRCSPTACHRRSTRSWPPCLLRAALRTTRACERAPLVQHGCRCLDLV